MLPNQTLGSHAVHEAAASDSGRHGLAELGCGYGGSVSPALTSGHQGSSTWPGCGDAGA
jgi:hypothetical protein